ncbi:aldehyde dehydrogenase family protein [Psychrobacter sp. AOP22-C1-22]|uniref:aldehyde dehydrogenase family protein n=1 Tax=unclassified Psychrobacter TaxID=196806 RepID=UPI001787D85B|nr:MULTISPECIES: aldehyde dehydrogenase family protein [unclassified Psychrobacter]MBE0406837.1 aldehyde dehydrogenase family protein [Psychrobacter sp. FME6]MBE0445863.1 aldehyde dehydrogenase family protein [Psychrobacter sp. FME5]MDN5801832.1 aldehyde dehydrogenase family protein [Psychrobacter sp.]MDN5897940.1 aldehyde dehydrogenase family protein [Psychrobacter sp.]
MSTDTNSTKANAYKNFHLQYIAGEWQSGKDDSVNTNVNPYNGDTLVEIQQATDKQLDEAYKAANAAQKEWAQKTPIERASVLYSVVNILDQRQDEVVDWLIKESGSTRIKALAEFGNARAITLEAATFPNRVHGEIRPSNTPGKENFIYREPIGVVAVISPWNFPLHLTQRSIAPALALGNAVVLKPASDTPITGGLLLAKVFEEAGLPKGLLNVVVGAGSEIGDAIVTHDIPSLVSFTGSTSVGKHIGELANGGDYIKQVALELGGNSPFVVLKDADIEQAVKAAVFGKFLHQGQICIAINRIIVEDEIYDDFVERFLAHVKTLNVGDPNKKDTAVGPIINEKQVESLKDKIAKAQQEGAKMLLSGEIKGQLVPPHIFTNVTREMDLSRHEVFGPLVGIIRAKDEDDALSIANDSMYGLSSAVFTKDMAKGLRFARGIRAGMTHINDVSVNDESNVPFGGEKNSGIGRFNGEWVLEEFTRTHWISMQHEPRDYPF